MRIFSFFVFWIIISQAEAQIIEWEQGQYLQGGYLIGKTDKGNQVSYLNQNINLAPDGRFLIGFGRDASLKHVVKVTLANGDIHEETIAIKRRDYKIERIDGLPPSKVTPRTKEQLARIRSDIKLVKKARANFIRRNDFLTDFSWPLLGRISGVYGSQRILNGKPKRPHYGVDVAAPTGTKVSSPNGGIVTLVHNDMFFTGGTLIIDHGYGLSSTFIHLSEIFVKEGDEVKQGDLIAAVGATGRATGPHLDWRINWFSHRLDPELFVEPMSEQKNNSKH